MKFGELAERFFELERTASRLAMTEQLVVLFSEVRVEEIDKVCYLALGRLAPLYERVEFNLAEKMVVRAIAQAFEMEGKEVWGEYKKVGDLGEVAQALRGADRNADKTQISGNSEKGVSGDGSNGSDNSEGILTSRSLTDSQNDGKISVGEVYGKLMGIAVEGGEGSQERKVTGLADLLKSLDGLSGKYVVRIVIGKLRLGFSDKTILDALAVMDGGSKAGRKELDAAYQVFPNVGELAKLVKQFGVRGLDKRVSVTMGVPVVPALAQRLKTADEMIEKMGKVIAEPKWDGTRVQIHFARGESRGVSREYDDNSEFLIRTFTRNLDENSHMFPELMEGLSQIQAKEVILDGEAVGVHPKTGKLLPFQMTITRKRKHGIEDAARTVPLKFFVYDMLYKDGREMLREPLYKRREMLKATIKSGKVLEVAEAIVTKDPKELREFHAEQLDMGLEGALVKKYDGEYRPGRLGWNWVKFKESETSMAKLADTLDVVVMGYYRGKGKRVKFGVGAFLVGINANGSQESTPEGGQAVDSSQAILTVAKIGTGLTDEQWRELKMRCDNLVAMDMHKDYQVPKGLTPDVWVEPELVVEVAADEITKSPMHSAGLALRFPRLVKFRDDKDLSGVTSLGEMREIGEK